MKDYFKSYIEQDHRPLTEFDPRKTATAIRDSFVYQSTQATETDSLGERQRVIGSFSS